MYLIYICSVLCGLVLLLVTWWKKTYCYWAQRNVKARQPLPILGNYLPVLLNSKSELAVMEEIYKEYPNEKVVGVYQALKPALLVRDPEIIKKVLVKDFQFFDNRGVKTSNEFIDKNLFAEEGEAWRMLRQKLTPIFTSGKIKNMMSLIQKSTNEYLSYVDDLVKSNKDCEIRTLVAKYTLNVIGSCAFGIDVNTFKEENNIFEKMGREIFSPSLSVKIVQALNFLIPNFEKLLHKFEATKTSNTVRVFFLDLIGGIVKEREGKPKVRKDFMDLLIELKEQGRLKSKESDKNCELEIDIEILAAQAFIFYAGGFETSAGTSSFLLYELAVNQDIQQKIYEEICDVMEKNNGTLTYDSLSDLKYMNMAFDETLRKYPIVGNLIRECQEDYVIPELNLKIEKGVKILISNLASQNDPKYFENPEKFIPERFSPEKKDSIPLGAYLPFGEGPRHCIGLRFARVQTLMGVASLLKNFKVERSAKTVVPLRICKKSFMLASVDGIWLNISKRQ